MKRALFTGILPAFLVATSVIFAGHPVSYAIGFPVIDHRWLIQSPSGVPWGVEQIHCVGEVPCRPHTYVYAGPFTYGFHQPIWVLALEVTITTAGILGIFWLGACVWNSAHSRFRRQVAM